MKESNPRQKGKQISWTLWIPDYLFEFPDCYGEQDNSSVAPLVSLRESRENKVTRNSQDRVPQGRELHRMRTLEIFRECPYGIWLRTDKHICMKKVTWGQRENILRKDQKRVAHSHTEQVIMPILTNQMNQGEKIYNSCGSGWRS